MSEGVEAAVPPTVRETVEALSELHSDGSEGVTKASLARKLGLDKSSAGRRVSSAMDRGYIRNLENRKGRPARLVPGDPLPADVEILPPPERLQGCTVAGVHEGVNEKSIGECIHGYPGGEGCYLCDLKHPYRLKEGART